METKTDMPRALIVAHLKMKGWSVAKLSMHHGYHRGTLNNALCAPWPKGERLIADALNMAPEDIWPSRYPEVETKGVA
ncbi:helix-turn-helix domain-containing protein [Vibrio algicola]|uniref:Transcriptional regulator n=1 Tax=Vibrio algicola TaxID=2662262 RepID=A0A5Q0THX5_9VIBR|nr:helix-turn-helix domain-containing protein [Vibrio algicola]